MKLPPRAKRCQEVISTMINWLDFYMGDTREFKEFVREDISYLEEYLSEVSEDMKTHNIRFASKLKGLWKKEMEEKDRKIRELQTKLGTK